MTLSEWDNAVMANATVQEVLTLSVLHGARVVAGGGGLGRIVTGVNVMEVPDIEPFVREGELLLTTGFPVRDQPQRLVEMLPALAERQLAGLAIKPLRYLAELPAGLLEVADELDFPVIITPDNTSFNDVIGSVLAVVLADYGAEPAGAEVIRERLTGVALSGGGLDGIASTLAAALDRHVIIADEDNVVLGRGKGAVLIADSDDADERDLKEFPWRFPITVGGAHRGLVLVSGAEEPTLGQRRLIRQSCFAAGMHIAQALASIELDRRMRALFLEELTTGSRLDETTLHQRARLFSVDLTGARVVMLAGISGEVTDQLVARVGRTVLPAGSVSWARSSEAVALVPASFLDPDPAHPLPGEARWRDGLIAALGGGVRVACGAPAATASEIARSHAQAREGLRIAGLIDQSYVRHQELEVERLLLANSNDVLGDFVMSRIGPLVEHDLAHGTDYCATLEAYLGTGNAAHAARDLFVHYNTMKHRLARIESLLMCDLAHPRTRLELMLALHTRRLDS